MSDQEMKATVRVDTASDTSGLDKADRELVALKARIAALGNVPGLNKLGQQFDTLTKKVAQVALGDFDKGQLAAMRALQRRFTFEGRLNRQRDQEEADSARSAAQREGDALRAIRAKMTASAAFARQRQQEERAAAQETASAERVRTAAERSALSDLKARLAFQGRMARQQAQDVRDLARQQMEAAREVANAARASAREQAAAMRAQAAQAREMSTTRAAAIREAVTGGGRIRGGIARTAVVGAAGSAVIGAGARRGMDKLTRSGIGIDEALTQASIHIFGSLPASEARRSAEWLRKRLMPVATRLGAKTADLIGAYVEASQAGVDSDILDKVTDLGSKYAKMNKLSLPNTLEESGYALQGLKSFGNVNDDVVSKYFNHSAYLVATTAANRTQMSSFGKRGLAAGASVGMSADDTLAFGAAATAAGAEGNQAARMLSSQGGRIAGWEMKAKDISRKQHKTEEDKQFLQAPRLLGFSGFGQLAQSFKRDFFDTFARVQEGLKGISDPLKRRSLEKQLLRQEFGSFTDAMVMGGNLREYRNKLKKPEADNFLEQNWSKQTGSFGFIVEQIQSVFGNLSDSLGLALKPIYSDIRDYAVALPDAFGNFEETFKVALKGFMGGLGSPDGTMSGLLNRWLGNPADLKLNTGWIGDFSRGFGRGLATVGDTVKRFLGAFTGGDTSAETLGRITAQFLGFSAAIIAAAPVVAVLGGLTTAITGLVAVIRGAAVALGATGAARGAAGAAGAGAAGAAEGAIGGAAVGGGLVARLGLGALVRRVLGGVGLSVAAEIGAHRGELATWLGAPALGSMIGDGIKAFLN